ncbi:MAG: D-aminoacyl-tRNA deacylase [Micrococcaceae bacterium]
MKAVIQRVRRAQVTVDDEVVGQLEEPGLTVLVGISTADTEAEAVLLAEKIYRLRILESENSCESSGAPLLVISQFTLYGDVRRGRRPSWSDAARPEQAEPLYRRVVETLRGLGAHVETGRFGAMMDVSLVNAGPFTVLVDTDELRMPRRSS